MNLLPANTDEQVLLFGARSDMGEPSHR